MFITCHRFITRLYVKRATHNSRKMIKNGSQIYFWIFGADILYVRSVSTSVVAILIGPHCRPYLGKDLCRIHERLDISFLKLKSVRSCALILKPNSVRWWERAHLCVRARVCVCVFVRIAAELRHARYREQRIVNARPCRDRNYMPSCK